MANPFVVKPAITQTDDPTVVIITHGSNYGNNDSNIQLRDPSSRIVTITDSQNNVVATLPMTLVNGVWQAQQVINKDVYYSYSLVVTVSATPYTGTTNYVTIGFYNQKFLQIMVDELGDCGCDSGLCTPVMWGRTYKDAAILAALKAQATNSQSFIDAANQFLNDVINIA